jgi:ferredoxin-NADP reductase
MTYIDSFLNKITMYRLVLLYLIVLLLAGSILGALGIMPYTPLSIIFSASVFIFFSGVTNEIFSRVFSATPGNASFYITALILTCIVTPVTPGDLQGTLFLAALAIWAMGSKYLFAIGKKHIFNPAAFAVATAGILLAHSASWWIAGNSYLMPIILCGGLLIARKIQRLDVVIAFFVSSLATVYFLSGGSADALRMTLLHAPVFFLAFTMLTDPATMPPTRDMRVAYGVLVGMWFAPGVHILNFYFSPELALLLGNAFVYLVSPKGRFILTLTNKEEIAQNTYEFTFLPEKAMPYLAGQYLEWTLPEGRKGDAKGNRRYFTIASSPTEKEIRLGVRMSDAPSAFKQTLLRLKVGDTVSAGQLAGDFTLPTNTKKKLVFIAGGIGVTPFRSMVQYILDTGKRDVVMFYSNKKADEVAYYDILERAREQVGMKTIYALTDDTRSFAGSYNGMISPEIIKKEVPDYRERTFYISGPRGMVLAFEAALKDLGIKQTRIKTDYFPGFA